MLSLRRMDILWFLVTKVSHSLNQDLCSNCKGDKAQEGDSEAIISFNHKYLIILKIACQTFLFF